MREESILETKNGWLQLVIDAPPKPESVWIFCHGLTGDRCGPQRILSYLADGISRHGAAAIRFDFRGSGDSSGDFCDTSFSQMTEDLTAVIRWAKQRYLLPIHLAGLSVGAVPAVLAAQKEHCEKLFLISSDLLDNPSFSSIKQPNPLRGGHFFLNAPYYTERAALSPRKLLAASNLGAISFYGELDEKVSQAAKEIEPLKGAVGIPEAGHLFESVPAREKLLKEMIKLL